MKNSHLRRSWWYLVILRWRAFFIALENTPRAPTDSPIHFWPTITYQQSWKSNPAEQVFPRSMKAYPQKPMRLKERTSRFQIWGPDSRRETRPEDGRSPHLDTPSKEFHRSIPHRSVHYTHLAFICEQGGLIANRNRANWPKIEFRWI